MRERARVIEPETERTDNYCSKRILGTQLIWDHDRTAKGTFWEPQLQSQMPGFASQLSHLQAVWSRAAWPFCASFSSSGSSWGFSEWRYENHYKWPSRQQVLRAWTIIIIIVITQNEKPVRQGNTAPENAFVSMQLDAFLFGQIHIAITC